MKWSGLNAAAVALVVLVAPPAFARNRHHSSQPKHASLDSQQMRITASATTEPVVASPVTVPEGSVYSTPLPKVIAALPPLPMFSERVVSTESVARADEPATSKVESAKTESGIDGASLDGVQTASIKPPSPSEPAKEVLGPPAPAKGARTPGAVLFDATHDDSALNPMSWAVSVFKKRHELIVYYKGRLFKKYDAVFGRNLDLGAKLWAQDRRTPEGVYYIEEKYRSARFEWFLRLNYPNLDDRIRYETMKVNGVIPVDSEGKSPLVGSSIGIHGTDVPILNAGHINWTTGCISLSNKDIDDLDRLLPVGTVVIIKP